MSLEWFSRMENAVRVSLPDLCEGFDEVDIIFDTDTTEQHPSFSFSIEGEDDYDEFCIVLFDPINQEFYSYHFDEEAELHAKVLFANLDQMLSFIHASFHDYMEELDEDYDDIDEVYELDDVDDFDDLGTDEIEEVFMEESDEDFVDSNFLEEDHDHIEWITNDKYIHIEDNSLNNEINYAIYYKLGIDKETGDGVLYRHTITKQNGDEEEENVLLYFKEEEASYITELISEYEKKKYK